MVTLLLFLRWSPDTTGRRTGRYSCYWRSGGGAASVDHGKPHPQDHLVPQQDGHHRGIQSQWHCLPGGRRCDRIPPCGDEAPRIVWLLCHEQLWHRERKHLASCVPRHRSFRHHYTRTDPVYHANTYRRVWVLCGQFASSQQQEISGTVSCKLPHCLVVDIWMLCLSLRT